MKYKILISVILTFICFNSLFTLYYIESFKSRETAKLNEKITETNELIKNTITETLWHLDVEKTHLTLEAFFNDQNIIFIDFKDKSGLMDIQLIKEKIPVTANDITNEISLVKNEEVLGKLVIIYTISDMKLQINQFSIKMFFLTLGLILLVSIVINFILDVITRPFKMLLKGMKLANTGNLDYRINITRNDEFGELSIAFDQMSENLKSITASRDELNREIEIRKKTEIELKKAIAEVKTLSGFLPICANCKKVRDDKGYWEQIDSYIKEHSNLEFSHGLCPDCAKKLYPDIQLKKKKQEDQASEQDNLESEPDENKD